MLNSTRKGPKTRANYLARVGVLLINRVSNEEYRCDIIGEDTIDGKAFYIVRIGARVLKLAKEGYELAKR